MFECPPNTGKINNRRVYDSENFSDRKLNLVTYLTKFKYPTMLENSERRWRKRMGEKEWAAERRRARKERERERRVACAVVAAKILFLQGEDWFVVLLLQREEFFLLVSDLRRGRGNK
jgi:hypothetical protein